LIFELSKTAGWDLFAFQIARQLRGDSADEISGDFHDQWRSRANRRSNLRVNLVPGQRFVAGNVECFTHSFALANQSREANRKIASAVSVHWLSPSSGMKTCLPCSRRAANE